MGEKMGIEGLVEWLRQHGGQKSRSDEVDRIVTGTDPSNNQPMYANVNKATVVANDGAKRVFYVTGGAGGSGHTYTLIGEATPTEGAKTDRVPVSKKTITLPGDGGPEVKVTVTSYSDGSTFSDMSEPDPTVETKWEKNADGSLTKITMKNGVVTAREAQAPKEPDQKYTQARQDETTGKWFGLTKDGKWEEMPGGPGLTPKEPKSKYSATKQDPTTGKWFGMTPAGEWEAMEGGPGVAKPTGKTHTINGVLYTEELDASGQITGLKRVPMTGGPSGNAPPIPTPADSQEAGIQQLNTYRQTLRQMELTGELSPEESKEAFRIAHEAQQAHLNAAIKASEGVYSTNVQQRGQDIQLANQRMSSSVTAMQNSMQNVMALNQVVQPGSQAAAKSLPAMMALQLMMSGAMGGTATPAREQPGGLFGKYAGVGGAAPTAGGTPAGPGSLTPEAMATGVAAKMMGPEAGIGQPMAAMGAGTPPPITGLGTGVPDPNVTEAGSMGASIPSDDKLQTVMAGMNPHGGPNASMVEEWLREMGFGDDVLMEVRKRYGGAQVTGPMVSTVA